MPLVGELRERRGGGLGGEWVRRLQRQQQRRHGRLERRTVLMQPARPRSEQRAPCRVQQLTAQRARLGDGGGREQRTQQRRHRLREVRARRRRHQAVGLVAGWYRYHVDEVGLGGGLGGEECGLELLPRGDASSTLRLRRRALCQQAQRAVDDEGGRVASHLCQRCREEGVTEFVMVA
eukprot:scaffold124113_cov63-Phaeocystis_antarctica.AAC.4